jgi:large-conductance mechanosensitive channel
MGSTTAAAFKARRAPLFVAPTCISDPLRMLCFESFRSFMFTNKIAGASVAFAIGLASSEFAKSLTFKAVIPCLQRVLEHAGVRGIFGKLTPYDFTAVNTMALYWICMIGVSYIISEYIFGRLLLGTATVLTHTEKKSMEEAKQVVQQEDGAIATAQSVVAAVVGQVTPGAHSAPQFDAGLLPAPPLTR